MERRIIQINTTCGVGSTGKIAVSISNLLTERKIENYILFSSETNGYPKGICCGNKLDRKIQALKSRVLGNYGFNSKAETRRIIQELKRLKPTAVLIHNIHGHDCNLEELFAYLQSREIKIFWVFHDCWAFTGYCTHFTYAECDRWKSGCGRCPQRRQASWFFDRSAELWQRKKRLLSGLDLTIISPSQWLADLVKQSFLKDYPVKVIHNGIDLAVFKPTPSDFREKHGIGVEKMILLGVAFNWDYRKGLDIFIELAKHLNPNQFQIVLVGTNRKVDKQLLDCVISIHRTQNQRELAEIYTAADIFVNPTREEVLGLVNIEAQACGTPVVTFDTGGSPETLDMHSGCVVKHADAADLICEIEHIKNDRPYHSDACQRRAGNFDAQRCFAEYLELLEMCL